MTNQPRTLLEMAGAKLVPPTFEAAVVVVVDAQNEYLDGALALPGIGPASAAIARLLAAARAAGAPVIHVVHHGRPGGLFDPEGRGAAIIDACAPAEGEAVCVKGLPNSFTSPAFVEAVKATGRQQLILTGFMAHMCVSSTARAALDHGLFTCIPADAVADRDLPDPLGGVQPAAALVRAELAALADRFSLVVPSVEVFL
ncbi:isochorismatase family protein [Roseospirillum parvum]|uniref:Nicotinamidase-related amidase n=1 Tax=Roseospirillum parvum TaxID=83401 RepID=A0A1G7UE64_9PROT|nr:isochorismatase family protein [Roseospirillum parvum]SDG45872.1 Nicotinamidase-related amidase [Roseospirillum parvum]